MLQRELHLPTFFFLLFFAKFIVYNGIVLSVTHHYANIARTGNLNENILFMNIIWTPLLSSNITQNSNALREYQY